MKLDKIKFAKLVAFISSIGTLGHDDIEELDRLIDIDMPEQQAIYPLASDVEQLMALMHQGTQKIEAIKLHRKIAGYGLKESKDTVEKYWPDGKLSYKDLQAKLNNTPLQGVDFDIIDNFIVQAFKN